MGWSVAASLVALGAAVGSAVLEAVGTALQHRSATTVDDGSQRPGWKVVAFVRAELVHPVLLVSFVVDAAGFGLQALALHFGTLARVQPVLVLALVFALPIDHWMRREPIATREFSYSGALVAGLAGFLLLTQPSGPAVRAGRADPGFAVGVGVLTVFVVFGCALAARRTRAGAGAALLGTAAGVAFAIVAALVKACTDLLANGVVALLGSWPVYALLGVGAMGLVTQQLAFRTGSLSASLPAITIVNPLLAIVIGVLVYGERLRHTPVALAGALVCLAVFSTAAILLTQLKPGTGPVEPGGA
jgi:drug/metabolite transporter (DMT)-like permease